MRTPTWFGIPYTRRGFDLPWVRLPSFKDVQNGDVVFIDAEGNFGTGKQFFRIVNRYQFEDDTIKFVMVADLDADEDAGDLENFKTNNPRIFSYIIDYEGLSSDYNVYNVDDLTVDTLAMYLEMPGAMYDDDE